MICTKCNEEGVHNVANGKEFFYCRTCKEEIGLQNPPKIDVFQALPQKDKDEYEDWLKYLTSVHHVGDGNFLEELAIEIDKQYNGSLVDYYSVNCATDEAYKEGYSQAQIDVNNKHWISET